MALRRGVREAGTPEEAIKTLRAVLDTDQMFGGPAAARRSSREGQTRTRRRPSATTSSCPDLDAARQTLLGIYQRDGRIKEAIEVAQEALDRDPTSIPWAFTLGRLRQDEGEHDLAAQLYASLFDQTQNPAYLRAQVRALMSREVPAVSEIRRLTVENQRLFRQDPGCWAATAWLVRAGRSRTAFDSSSRPIDPRRP